MNSGLLESSEDEAGFGSGGSWSEHSGKPRLNEAAFSGGRRPMEILCGRCLAEMG
jgi:hypothetical protein